MRKEEYLGRTRCARTNWAIRMYHEVYCRDAGFDCNCIACKTFSNTSLQQYTLFRFRFTRMRTLIL